LEDEQMYAQYQVDHGRKDHWAMYPCPKTIPVVYESVTAATAPIPPLARTAAQKPGATDLLQTILVRLPPPFLSWGKRLEEFGGQPVVTALRLAHIQPDDRREAVRAL